MTEANGILAALSIFAAKEREAHRNPVGTESNPYVIVVPKWYEERCLAEGTTPQEVYDQTYAGTPFRHGRVEVMGELP